MVELGSSDVAPLGKLHPFKHPDCETAPNHAPCSPQRLFELGTPRVLSPAAPSSRILIQEHRLTQRASH